MARSGRIAKKLLGSVHQVTYETGREHVVVSAGEQPIADTRTPVVVHETGLPTRYYVSREDVRMELLEPSPTRTTCPFKGEASYWTARVGDEAVVDVAWSYEDPIPEAEAIRGLLCFYADRALVEVDGSTV